MAARLGWFLVCMGSWWGPPFDSRWVQDWFSPCYKYHGRETDGLKAPHSYWQNLNSVDGSSWYPHDEVSPMFGPLHSEGKEEALKRPYGDIVLSLGEHLALKIWRDENVDIFSLLHTEPETVPKVGEPACDQEVMRKRKIDRNWTNWLYGYAIYIAVVVQL